METFPQIADAIIHIEPPPQDLPPSGGGSCGGEIPSSESQSPMNA